MENEIVVKQTYLKGFSKIIYTIISIDKDKYTFCSINKSSLNYKEKLHKSKTEIIDKNYELLEKYIDKNNINGYFLVHNKIKS